MKRYLFVCGQNKQRSPVVAAYFSDLLKEKNIEAIVTSAGLMSSSPTILTKEMADSADIIFAMEETIKKEIVENYAQSPKKVVNLDILDVYFMGRFNKDLMLSSYCKGKNREEYDKIWNRFDIKNGFTLDEVLETKRLCFEHYIDID